MEALTGTLPDVEIPTFPEGQPNADPKGGLR